MPPFVIDLHKTDDPRDVVHRAVQALAEGHLVAFPTETVYGLAASALRPEAVERLVAAKGRPEGQPLTLAIKSADEALDYAPRMSGLAQRLARRCWPGPVTLVLEDDHPDSLLSRLPDSVVKYVAPHGAVGLRVPAHATVLDVLRMLVGPIVLSSANRSGGPDPLTAKDVVDALDDDVQLVLDDGASRYGQASTVVRVRGSKMEVLREGVVSEAALKRLGSLMILFVCTGNTCRSPMAEAIFRRLAAEKLGCEIDQIEDRGVVATSAGISAFAGGHAAAEAEQVMREMGLDLSGHHTQPLTEQLVRHADAIFTMTAAHRAAVLAQWPEAAPRVHLLRVDETDISDPIGGPIEVYRQCAKQLEAELKRRIEESDIEGIM